MSTEHTARARTYYLVYALLLACTYLTWQVAYFDLGAVNTVVALGLAAFKASLVAVFFMHVRSGPRLTWVAALAGLFWFGILLVLTAGDYLTRGLR